MSDGGSPEANVADAPAIDATTDGTSGSATYRNSLSVCWRDAACPRALAISHGGDWTVSGNPYDSNAALEAAFANGADGVKIDVRVSIDDVPVISHSSPLQTFESLDCANQKIEEMTAAAVTACHRFPSPTQTFQRLDDVLRYLRGKLVVQLTVKRQVDYARAIAAVIAAGAQDFAFFEITTSDLQTLIPGIPGADQVYYLISIGNVSEVATLLGTIKNPRAFMYEFDSATALGTLVSAQLHPAGVRAFTYDKSNTATVGELKAFFDSGCDVVSANVTSNDVQARIQVNTARAVSPP